MKSYFTTSLKESALNIEVEKIDIMNLKIQIQDFFYLDFLECCIDNYNYSIILWEFLINQYGNGIEKLLRKPKLSIEYNNRSHSLRIQSFLQYLLNCSNILPTTINKCLNCEEIFLMNPKDKYYLILKDLIPLMSVNLPNAIMNNIQFSDLIYL